MTAEETKEVHSPPDDYEVENLGDYIKAFYLTSERLDNISRKSLFWSIRLMMETDGGYNFSSKIKGYKYTAFGYFKNEFRDDQFGIIVYADATKYFVNKIRRLANLFLKNSKPVPNIKVDGYLFRIVYRHIKEIKHSKTPNPINGTGACYVKSKKSHQPYEGILTVKHVVDLSHRDKIELSCGCTGKLVEFAPGSIDAAVISSDCSIDQDTHLNEVHPLQFVAQYIPVKFEGSESGYVKTRVRQISDTRGIYNHPSLPIAIFLSDSGMPGDSGALVEDEYGNPLGLYIGAYQCVETKERGGLAQHLFQAKEIMNIKLLK